MADTAKNWPIGKAPKRIKLLGDKTKIPESAEHIIEFPGGAVEVARTSDGSYWAHIIINRDPVNDDGSTRETATGEVIGSRLDRNEGRIDSIEREDSLHQIAVLIRPHTTGGKS